MKVCFPQGSFHSVAAFIRMILKYVFGLIHKLKKAITILYGIEKQHHRKALLNNFHLNA